MAATLKDVAEMAGVSIATVSRVLNVPERVAEQSRSKVLEAVEKLGYSSNLLAKSLRQDGLNVVYVLLPSLSDPYLAQIHQGISDVLSSYDYLMVSLTTEGARDLEHQCLMKSRAMAPSGILIYSPNDPVPEAWDTFSASFPILFLSGNRVTGSGQMLSLPFDHRALGRQGAEFLFGSGRRSLIYLCSNPGGVYGQCWEGIREAAEAAGCGCRICQAGCSTWDVSRVLGKAFADPDCPPDCVLAQSGLQAMGALSFFRERGIGVPEQVAVMSCENTEMALFTQPQISVTGPTGYQLGMAGAKQLLERIQSPQGETPPRRGSVPLTLISRGSTDGKQ